MNGIITTEGVELPGEVTVDLLLGLMEKDKLIGIFNNIPDEVYHAGPGLSRSQLVDFAVSPSFYYMKKKGRRRQIPSQREGRLCHMAALEPERFAALFQVVDGNRNSNAVKAAIREAEDAGKVVVKSGELVRWHNIANSINIHPDLKRLHKAGKPEQSIYWKDPETGLLCKARTDWLTPDWTIVDHKTCGAMVGDERRLKWHFTEMRYDWQSAWYLDGVSILSGKKQNMFVHALIDERDEYDNYHPIEVRVLTDADLECARYTYRPLMQDFASCLRMDDWSGIKDMALPENNFMTYGGV